MVKCKYEIRTYLLSARARHFESDERDLSPVVFTIARFRPGELDEDELATLCHIFFAHLFFDRVVVGLGSGDSGASQITCPSSSYRFRMRCSSLCLNLKNIFSFPTRKWISPLPTCSSGPQEWSPKDELDS